MNRHRSLVLLASVALATATLGACSKSSPTEPSPLASAGAPSAATASSSLTGVADESRGRGRGGDGGSADDNGRSRRGRGNGSDDTNDDRGRRRGRGGRGNDDRPADPRPPRVGQEFEASVVAVAGQTITLAGGGRVRVDGSTQWDARGDLFTLAQVAGSVASGDPTRVEGRGTRQTDGSILALTIKAEVDN